MKKGEKLQFCPQGHDTFICGRRKGYCINCNKEKGLIYYNTHKVKSEKSKKIKLSLVEKNKRKKRSNKKYYEENKKIILIKCKKYRETHKEQIRKGKQRWAKKNKKKLLLKRKEYYTVNKKIILIKQLKYWNKRYKKDIYFKLVQSLRRRIRQAIRGNVKKGSAVRDLGCSIEFFKQYIEKKFYSGMTWDNWSKVWQLDHIVPLWKFNLDDAIQFKQAVNYTNMQPLTIKDHRIKTDKENINRNQIKWKI